MSPAARVAFALLVLATFGAFFVAQRLKAEPSAVSSFERTRFFSPNGDGVKDVERFSFRLKESDDVTVDVVDADGGRVRRLVTSQRARRGRPVRLRWLGTTDAGTRAPDGVYRARIVLRRQGRSVVPPFAFHLDTRAPQPAVVNVATGGGSLSDRVPPVTAPGRPVRILIRGAGPRGRPRFRVLDTTVDPPRVVRTFRGRRGNRRARWDGRDEAGAVAGPGTYLIAVGARDRAGNLGWGPRLPPRAGTIEGRPGVTVRGLAVQPPVEPVRAGELVTFRVDARGSAWRWQIRRVGEPRARKRARRAKRSTALTVRAPGGVSGVYLLEVRSGRRTARVPFAVQAADRQPLLVVLPAISWLGSDPLDDPGRPDGIPNSLLRGQSVPYPRPFVGDQGLPTGFADEVAPLLVTLDRARVRYDLTTDLALARSRDPRPTDRPGVAFAGSPRWVTRTLARRLRAYVAAGGRVALFEPGALRAGVRIGRTRLGTPTPPGPADAFGQRLARVRDLAGGTPLTALTDDPPELPVLTGFDGELDHRFGSVEELISPGRGEVVAAIGAGVTEEEAAAAEAEGRTLAEPRPAFTTTKLGKGYVLRTGIPGWSRRLAEGDAEVTQLTRNIVDLLRRVNPRPRTVGR